MNEIKIKANRQEIMKLLDDGILAYIKVNENLRAYPTDSEFSLIDTRDDDDSGVSQSYEEFFSSGGASGTAAMYEVVLTMTPEILAALKHVREVYPDAGIVQVMFGADSKWFYCNSEFEGPVFEHGEVDQSLLEAAADSIEFFPAAFCMPNLEEVEREDQDRRAKAKLVADGQNCDCTIPMPGGYRLCFPSSNVNPEGVSVIEVRKTDGTLVRTVRQSEWEKAPTVVVMSIMHAIVSGYPAPSFNQTEVVAKFPNKTAGEGYGVTMTLGLYKHGEGDCRLIEIRFADQDGRGIEYDVEAEFGAGRVDSAGAMAEVLSIIGSGSLAH